MMFTEMVVGGVHYTEEIQHSGCLQIKPVRKVRKTDKVFYKKRDIYQEINLCLACDWQVPEKRVSVKKSELLSLWKHKIY